MNKPISAEARDWAIEQIKAHGEYSSLDDLLRQADVLARYFGKTPVVTACDGRQHGEKHALAPLSVKDNGLVCPACGRRPFDHLNGKSSKD